MWTDEATFETSLDSRTCYVMQRPGTAMESRYLKPTFKSKRTTLGISGAITWAKKGPVHFLIKEGRIFKVMAEERGYGWMMGPNIIRQNLPPTLVEERVYYA